MTEKQEKETIKLSMSDIMDLAFDGGYSEGYRQALIHVAVSSLVIYFLSQFM